jgi:photosystem II stability/assembly factor-like uncharacterized protein
VIAAPAALPQPPVGPALAFADARHGWAAGAGGILSTVDGGRTWRRVSRTPVQALDAVSGRVAFALASDSLLRTRNGRTWPAVSHPGLVAVDFVDSERGYGLDGRGVLLVSRNGGRTFARARAPGRLQAVCATREGAWAARGNRVWARRGSRFVLRLRARLGGPGAIPVLGCRGSSVWVLFEEGAAAGSEGYDVFRSLDGGRTWRVVLAGLDPLRPRLPRLNAYSGPFSVLGRTAVFMGVCPACGRQPTTAAVVSRDGGRTWSRRATLDGYEPIAVSFVTPERGWLLTGSRRGQASAGLVWATTDGGRRWRLLLRSRALLPQAP